MKINVLVVLLLTFALVISFSACRETEQKELCVLCGKEATRTISGTAHTMEEYGVDIALCSQTPSSPTVYTASLCSSCVDLPVVKNPLMK